jgi:putative N6-adenine-specific DNA methylase
VNLSLFAVTAPGLEPFTQAELAALGITARPPQGVSPSGELHDEAGGVEFAAGLSGLYRANLELRTANRILARLGEFYAAGFDELRKKAARLPWEQYLHPGQQVAVRVTCRKSRLYHSDAVAREVVKAIAIKLGKPAALVKFDSTTPPPQLVVVRLAQDVCTISLDASGELLHRRGYRLETAKAPLRETLAAGLLLAAGWDASSPLLDPFCGSGTIPIEAAMLARRIAPGKDRRFAFMHWPGYDSDLWHDIYSQALKNETASPVLIQASDRDAGAIRIAQANASRAGLLEGIQFTCQAFSAIQPPPGPGWVVTNPPYGVRVSPTNDLRNLYTHLGDVLRALCPGWHTGILCSSDFLAGHTRLPFDRTLSLVNGGIAARFYCGQIK